ncbi:hypothetical protein AAFC00_003858 [Neodothiora populina]|uniref:Kinesin motor domain-containing protein n=1 Tax=Neodothiora populina TaxID=2781224 RepID=A0ABR3PFK9_9PEZI
MTSSSYQQRSHPPPNAPPSIPLPPLPMGKTRRSQLLESPERSAPRRESSGLPSLSAIATPTARRSVTASPVKTTRSVTMSAIPTPRSAKTLSSPSVPTVNTIQSLSSSAIPTSQKTLRKTVSIEAFPQPPIRQSRLPSYPPSPLSASVSLEALAPAQDPPRPGLASRSNSIRVPKAKPSTFGLKHKSSASSLRSPSLLNSAFSGDARSISGARGTDSLLGLPSPAWSRQSSQRDSTSVEGSVLTDLEDENSAAVSPRKSVASHRDSIMSKESKGNVIVSVRVRPDAGGGTVDAQQGEWMVDGRRSLVSFKGREGGEYVYDNVFSAYDNNARVYDSAAKRLVRRVMEGYNGTVFAYGMTGTGKTFSMQGTANSPGVIPLAITDIFSYIRENPNREFLLRVSYLEIYNEKLFDLLSLSSSNGQQQEEIKLREDSRRGVYATPLKEEIVQSPNQLLRVIAKGDQARKVAGTQFNARSSRSHAVVQIVVESRERTSPNTPTSHRHDVVAPGGVLVSTLSLIDLAGSEKAADNRERRTEGSHINKSLLTLGTVIARLSVDEEGDKPAEKGQKHLPYRDSKLTRLLQPALSGGSLVSILCTIQLSSAAASAAAAATHTNETLNTLKFASRAKNNIVSHAKRNVTDPGSGVDAGSRALLDRYRLEIAELRQQLEEQSKVKEEPDPEPDPDRLEEEEERWRERQRESELRHEEQMLEMQLARTALKERISHLNRLILSSKSIGVNSGRFSSASTVAPQSNRVSLSSAVDLANSRRQSAASSVSQHTLSVSAGSATLGMMPSAAVSQIELASASDGEDIEPDSSESTSGRASKDRRIRALQADLSDKNRYIATLEKRLIQARRSSHSRPSAALSPQHESGVALSERDVEAIIKEKDRENEDLRAKLDDQIRMVTALRSAARKRDVLDSTFGGDHPAYRRGGSFGGAVTTNGNGQAKPGSQSPTRSTSSKSGCPRGYHGSQPSNGSSVQNFSRLPLSPVAVLSDEGRSIHQSISGNSLNADGKDPKKKRRTVDEMTRLLDEMIQEKVDEGHVTRNGTGSLRVKRDAIMDRLEKERDAMIGAAEQVA